MRISLRLEALNLAQARGMRPLAWLSASVLAEHNPAFEATVRELRQALDRQTPEQFSELRHRKKRLSVAPFSVLLGEIRSV